MVEMGSVVCTILGRLMVTFRSRSTQRRMTASRWTMPFIRCAGCVGHGDNCPIGKGSVISARKLDSGQKVASIANVR